jgi:hypothetical protein
VLHLTEDGKTEHIERIRQPVVKEKDAQAKGEAS